MLTSVVSVEAPESLLLEVAGSLKLFGSLEAIKAKLREEPLGVIAISGFAPRRRRPALCGWRERRAPMLQWRQLAGSLAALPLKVTRWPPEVQALPGPRSAHRRRLCAVAERRFRASSRALLFARARSSVRPQRRFACRVQSAAGLEPRLPSSARKASTTQFSSRRSRSLHELCAELEKRQAEIASLELA